MNQGAVNQKSPQMVNSRAFVRFDGKICVPEGIGCVAPPHTPCPQRGSSNPGHRFGSHPLKTQKRRERRFLVFPKGFEPLSSEPESEILSIELRERECKDIN